MSKTSVHGKEIKEILIRFIDDSVQAFSVEQIKNLKIKDDYTRQEWNRMTTNKKVKQKKKRRKRKTKADLQQELSELQEQVKLLKENHLDRAS